MIGRIRSDGLGFAYIAKAKTNSTIWKRLSDDFNNATVFSNNGQCIPVSTFDIIKQGRPTGGSNNAGTYETINSQNAFLNAHYGGVASNGQAILSSYFYLEGLGGPSAYSSSSSLHFRGYVKHCYTGVASLLAASQVLDPFTENRILSTGGSLFQGMRII
jgi:hypothetical protein